MTNTEPHQSRTGYFILQYLIVPDRYIRCRGDDFEIILIEINHPYTSNTICTICTMYIEMYLLDVCSLSKYYN